MANRTADCAACGALKTIAAKGLCWACYQAGRRGGRRLPRRKSPSTRVLPRAETRAEFIRLRIAADPTTGCWEWTGARQAKGYGSVVWRGRGTPAHRAAWEEFVGPIPAGLEIDHLCRNRGCVNPAHLEPVTHVENVRRGDGFDVGARQRAKTHCPQGHPYDEANTYRRAGRRYCITCTRARSYAWYHARKASQSGRLPCLAARNPPTAS